MWTVAEGCSVWSEKELDILVNICICFLEDKFDEAIETTKSQIVISWASQVTAVAAASVFVKVLVPV